MRKRTLGCVLGLFMGLLLIPGCSGNAGMKASAPVTEEQPDNLLPLMIMVEDALYQHSIGALDSSIKIEDGQILGHITKNLANEVPTQNGEACWVEAGTPYARCPLPEYPEGMVALVRYEWWLFLPVPR